MKLYADEGIDRQVVDTLRSAGFDVAYAAESDPAVADDALLGKAAAEGGLLLTSDKDFGELERAFSVLSPGMLRIRAPRTA